MYCTKINLTQSSTTKNKFCIRWPIELLLKILSITNYCHDIKVTNVIVKIMWMWNYHCIFKLKRCISWWVGWFYGSWHELMHKCQEISPAGHLSPLPPVLIGLNSIEEVSESANGKVLWTNDFKSYGFRIPRSPASWAADFIEKNNLFVVV